jgi:subtilase family serine protease
LRKHLVATVLSALMLFALTFFTLGGTAFAAPTTTTAPARLSYVNACAQAPVGSARCLALVATLQGSNKPLIVHPHAHPTGGNPPYGPSDFHNAYNLPNNASGTPTVGIVDAYSNPNLASDLATYRSGYGLPACTVGSGCLKIVNQTGGSKLPPGNTGWGLEESLDVDMVSAICENCHILVVEATSPNNANLGIAVNEAVKLGAVSVSNSYGEGEFGNENKLCSKYYTHTHVAVTASTGDSGPGLSYPAICHSAIGVGGTTLTPTGVETAWSGSGGGCSAYVTKPAWQVSSLTNCSKRAVADVSADADPNTGAYVYDTYGYGGGLQVGGTSESSPIIASVYALAGNVSSTKQPASLPWKNYSSGCLFKVGATQYAFQSGLGSPDGTSCF